MPIDIDQVKKEVAKTSKKKSDHLKVIKTNNDLENDKKVKNLKKEYKYSKDLEFWEWKENESNGKTTTRLTFVYLRCYNFLQSNGFCRHEILGRDYLFVNILNKKVIEKQPYQIKDYVMGFLRKLGDEKVLEMMFKGGKSYLGNDSLSNLEIKKLTFNRSTRSIQYFYFKNKVWEISSGGIKTIRYDQLPAYVWDTKIKNEDPELIKNPLFTIKKKNNKFDLAFTDQDKGDFLNYLVNTSRMYWREEEKRELTDVESYEQNLSFINKVTAIGYLLHTYRDEAKSWAVVAMDIKESEVGESNGGTGKSLLGKAIARMLNTFYMDGKNRKLFDNPHLYHGLDERTDYVFFDDVRIDFDFEHLYPFITGVVTVNPKNGKPYTIPGEDVPKTFITTNHALKGNGDSDNRRQFLVSFADYYHRKRTPFDEFGRILLSEAWNKDQWSEFYNTMALCVQYYLKFGKVDANIDNLERRKQRQFIGELFLSWAEEYFSDTDKFNIELKKMDLHMDFKNKVGHYQEKYYPITRFKKCLKLYCIYNGYMFNPDNLDKDGSPGEDIKRNGTEYFIISRPKEVDHQPAPDQPKQKDLPF